MVAVDLWFTSWRLASDTTDRSVQKDMFCLFVGSVLLLGSFQMEVCFAVHQYENSLSFLMSLLNGVCTVEANTR